MDEILIKIFNDVANFKDKNKEFYKIYENFLPKYEKFQEDYEKFLESYKQYKTHTKLKRSD